MTILSRQDALIRIPPEFSVVIAGCGNVGSNAFHMLVSMGIMEFLLVDGDDVDPANIAAGYFNARMIGTPKTDAILFDFQSRFDVRGEEHFDNVRIMSYAQFMADGDKLPGDRHSNIMLLTTDSLPSRRLFWKLAKDGAADWIIDGRMGETEGVVYCVSPLHTAQDQLDLYEDTLAGEGAQLNCGMKATSPITKGLLQWFIGRCAWDIIKGKTPPYYQRNSLGDGVLATIDGETNGQ